MHVKPVALNVSPKFRLHPQMRLMTFFCGVASIGSMLLRPFHFENPRPPLRQAKVLLKDLVERMLL